MLGDEDVRLMQGIDQLTFGESLIAEQVDRDWKRPGELAAHESVRRLIGRWWRMG